MATAIAMADEGNSAELDVVGDSHLVHHSPVLHHNEMKCPKKQWQF